MLKKEMVVLQLHLMRDAACEGVYRAVLRLSQLGSIDGLLRVSDMFLTHSCCNPLLNFTRAKHGSKHHDAIQLISIWSLSPKHDDAAVPYQPEQVFAHIQLNLSVGGAAE